ncbi:carph-isopro domain-containing protein [Kiloniella sp. b19]|uniref:carph-isopro domain-containing protein n=1 Tax=Kiloniella sp. GXU_MW_B19 TaxID=3141326 RepID=UPI0031DD76A0
MTDRKKETPSRDNSQNSESPTQEIINAFGGLRPLAKALGVAVSTVQGWKERDSIPAARHEEILKAAADKSITLDVARVRASDSLQGEGTQDPQKEDDKAAPSGKSAIPTAGSKDKVVQSQTDKKTEPVKKDERQEAVSDKDKVAVEAKPVKKGSSLFRSALLGAGLTVVALGAVVYFRGHWLPLVEKLPIAAGGVSQLALSDVDQRLSSLEDVVYGQQSSAANSGKLESDVRTLRQDYNRLFAQLRDLGASGSSSPSSGGSTDLSSLETQLRNQARRLDRLERRPAGDGTASAPAVSADVTGLESEIGRLQGEISSLRDQVANQPVGTASPVTAPGGQDVYLALSILQLRDALRGSAPFVRELDLVRNVAQGRDTVLMTLEPLNGIASTGLPSLTGLKTDFPAVARAVVSADKIDAAEGWIEKAVGRVTNLVSVRETGPQDGQQVSAVLWRAEELLSEDDLAGAVRELRQLQGPTLSAADEWLVRADQRLQAAETLRQLTSLLAGVTEQGAVLESGGTAQ